MTFSSPPVSQAGLNAVVDLDEPTNNLDPASRAEILGASANIKERSSWSLTMKAQFKPLSQSALFCSRMVMKISGKKSISTSSVSTSK